jgi:hypothetical protein
MILSGQGTAAGNVKLEPTGSISVKIGGLDERKLYRLGIEGVC